MERLREELAMMLERRTRVDGTHETAIPGLKLYRSSHPTEPAHFLYAPAVYAVVQGRKQVTLGEKTYVYDRSQYLAVPMELPVIGTVTEASAQQPYLCISLEIDPRDIAALIMETGLQVLREKATGQALYVSPLELALLDAFVRLVRLLDAPADISVVAPLIHREVTYRLLHSEQGGQLAQMAVGNGRLRRVSAAIAWIKEHYAEPMQIDALAKHVHMSPSGLHHHFKGVTGMSPVQYQKKLRLHQARHLLVVEGRSAEVVAHSVGYASASQFSREYARLFGLPPRRDAERVRDAVATE